MEALTLMPDFDKLYQSVYPAPTVQLVSPMSIHTGTLPDNTFKAGLNNTEIILGIVCVGIFIYGCYHLYSVYQQTQEK